MIYTLYGKLHVHVDGLVVVTGKLTVRFFKISAQLQLSICVVQQHMKLNTCTFSRNLTCIIMCIILASTKFSNFSDFRFFR